MKKEIPPSELYYITKDKKEYSDILQRRSLYPSESIVELISRKPRQDEMMKEQICIRIDCDLMYEDGFDFATIKNGSIWTTTDVPVRYFIYGK